MNLLDLMVKIGIDDQVTSKIGGVAGKITSGLGTAAKVGATAMAGLAAATATVTTAMAGAASATADYGDNIDKMSQKMGMSAQAYQEWDAVMQHSGTSIESMQAGMKTLANAVESGNEAFKRIGLTQEEIASMSQEDLFAATIEGLQNVEDTTERTYLAGQLLGRGATELGALLNTSAEDTQKMRDRVHELGGVMSDDAVKSSAAFKDSLQDLQTGIGGLRNNLMADFLPSITQVMNGLQELVIGNTEDGQAMIDQGIAGAIEAVESNAPKFLEKIGALAGSVLTAITRNAPQVVGAVASGIGEAVSAVRENVPEMMAAAGEFVMGIASAIVKNAPQIIADLLGLLVEMVGYVIQHAPEMLAAAGELFGQLVDAIGEIDIIGEIGSAIQGAIDSLGEFVGGFFDAGARLIGGLIDGILSAIGGIGDAMMQATNEADAYLQHSPAKKGPFSGRGYTLYSGRSMMQSLAQGIRDDTPTVANAMKNAVSGLQNTLETPFTLSAGAVASSGAFGPYRAFEGGNTYIVQNLEYMPGTAVAQHVQELFEDVGRELRMVPNAS